MNRTLPTLFARRRPAPETVLLDLPGGQTFTYGDADAASAAIANGLRAAGVGPGDRVAAHVEKAPEVVFLYLACLRAGAVFLPMNPGYTGGEVEAIVGDAEPTVVVRSIADIDWLAAAQPTTFDSVVAEPDDVAVMLYTSGTTGRPKGAMLTQANLASNAAALHEAWGFVPDDVLLHALPIFHAHGLFVALNCVLANGTGMVFLPRFDVDAVIEELPRCTVFMGVPTHYTRLLGDERFTADVCRNMRLFVSGSAPLLASTHEAFEARTGHAILERYGMTETVMNTSNPLHGARKPGTVGLPLPGVEIRLADQDDGGVGGIELRGPNVFPGYWRRPELNDTEFTTDGFFKTGDLGTFDDEGYLTIVGRSKDLIISGGLNVYPKEVEDALDAIDGVLESAVIGVPDADFGEAVVAVIVPEANAALDPEAIRTSARARLAAFKVPKRVVVVDELPRNAMGKVQKAALRSELA
ncbi:MAG: AMP-binding protein [Acidobacteria bacterium]|nr:AMP-binding protein [Acidobacteriota bacterium]